MSKICMLNPFFYPFQGGTEKHLLAVGSRLVQRGFDVSVLCVRMPHDRKSDEIEGMHIRRVDSLFLINSLPPFSPVPPPIALVPAMSNAIKSECRKHDLFHIHNRFMYSPQDAKNVKAAGKKLCLTLHNARTSGISPAVDLLGSIYDETNGREIMAECDAILGVSRNTIESTLPVDLGKETFVAYNGVDTKVYSPDVSPSLAASKYSLEGRKVILTVCRLETQKGLKYMVEAMRKLAHRDKSYLWVLVGTGSQSLYFRSLQADPRLKSHFLLIEKKITEREIAELYSACDLFVLPSVWEPFGMVICEALSAGKPVVSTTAGGIPEIVSKDCGTLCKPKDSAGLVRAIDEMFSDPAKMRRMGRAGRERVKKLFTWDRTADVYQKVYESLL